MRAAIARSPDKSASPEGQFGCDDQESADETRGSGSGWPETSLTVPNRSVQQRAGFRAEAFVDKAVSDAGHIWNTTA